MLGIALSIFVIFVYYILNAMAAAIGRNGTLDPYLAAWLPDIFFALAGGVMVFLEEQ